MGGPDPPFTLFLKSDDGSGGGVTPQVFSSPNLCALPLSVRLCGPYRLRGELGRNSWVKISPVKERMHFSE